MFARRASSAGGQRGVTLVELIVFIVVIGVGVAGLLTVTSPIVRDSADPMLRKQMVAVAESLLNEVMQQPFTYCDPDDANYFSATSTAGCAGVSQDKDGAAALTTPTPDAPTPETRYGAAGTQFDNVADYGGFSRTPIDDVAGGNPMPGYTASVAVARAGADFGLSASAVLRVTVTVQRPGVDNFSLDGYRFRYAPRN
ncbi:MAG: prepilin-type N-terminal cleavage/methylation domain-containing protein [Rhodocyclales bacterium]|nr:prepilin-type N-terminal cleavage/methylation domain-containing protein [Rhodocyclales bacterium]